MADQIKNVIVIGAGGNLGRPTVKALLESGKFDVTVLSRAESNSTFPSEVKVIKTDYTDAALADAFKGQDAVVSIVHGFVMDVQKRMIDIAADAGVKRFLPSEYGVNARSEAGQRICPVFKDKTDIVDYLQEKAKANPHFSWTSIVTGPFFDWGLALGFIGFDLKSNTATLFDGGDVRWSATNLDAIAKAVVGTLANPEKTKNRYIYTQSFCVTQNQVLQAVEKSSGKKWEVKHVKTADMIKEGREKMSKDYMSGIMLLIQAAIWNGDDTFGSDLESTVGIDNDLVGLPKEEDMQKTVDAVIHGEFKL